MKVIDERGMFFGKINIIDFLVILFLLFLMPIFYFGYKIMSKKPEVEASEREFVEIETNCHLIKLEPELLKHISVGDKELDETGQAIGEIISLGQNEPYKYEFDIGEGQKIIKEDTRLKQVETRLRLKVEVKNFKPYYKDKLIKIGSPFEFEASNLTFTAVPFGEVIEVPEREFVELETDCHLIKLEPELLKHISVEDKELDETGQAIGEIISLGQSEPYKYEFDIGEGQKIIKEDTRLKQVETRLRLKVEVKNFKPYYKNKVIKVGSPFEFKINNFILTAIPFEEEEEEERIIDLDVTLKNLEGDTLKKIFVGDKELDESGNTIAEVIRLGKVESNSHKLDLGGSNFVIGEDKTKKQISTKMRLKCQVRGGRQLYFKGKKVENDTLFEFRTNKYRVVGLVAKTFEETISLKKKWVSLQVKFFEVAPEISKIVQKGDTEKDAFEETIARIGSIISNEPAQVTTIFEGKFITVSHPFLRDIVVSLDVLCVEKEGAYYFKDYRVKMGNRIVFETDLYSISGVIRGME